MKWIDIDQQIEFRQQFFYPFLTFVALKESNLNNTFQNNCSKRTKDNTQGFPYDFLLRKGLDRKGPKGLIKPKAFNFAPLLDFTPSKKLSLPTHLVIIDHILEKHNL